MGLIDEKTERSLCRQAMHARGDELLRIEWKRQAGGYIAAGIESKDENFIRSAVYHIFYDRDGRFTRVEHKYTVFVSPAVNVK